MKVSQITRDEVVGRTVKRVLQSPWMVDHSQSDPPHYCLFYLLLETGLLVNLFEEEIFRSDEQLSTLIDTDELVTVQRANYIDQKITAVGVDHQTSELVVIFESGYWLTPKTSHMGYGDYLLSGHIHDLDEKDRQEPFVDYFEGTEIQPWVKVT